MNHNNNYSSAPRLCNASERLPLMPSLSLSEESTPSLVSLMARTHQFEARTSPVRSPGIPTEEASSQELFSVLSSAIDILGSSSFDHDDEDEDLLFAFPKNTSIDLQRNSMPRQ